MSGILIERLKQKHRTMRYPAGPAPEMPERWNGLPNINPNGKILDPENVLACPTGALYFKDSRPVAIDMGKCLFCGRCAARYPECISFGKDYSLARFDRESLVVGDVQAVFPKADKRANAKAEQIQKTHADEREQRVKKIRALCKRSFKIRQVSAGGCNACEADSNVLTTIGWDLSRFGISFVASPRHADAVLVTGPVTPNMRLALVKTYNAVPEPRVVIAVGACAISGGVYAGKYEQCGADGVLPVDMYIPGCPPHPLVILEGLLRLLEKV